MKELIKPNINLEEYSVILPNCETQSVNCGWLSCGCKGGRTNDKVEVEEDILF